MGDPRGELYSGELYPQPSLLLMITESTESVSIFWMSGRSSSGPAPPVSFPCHLQFGEHLSTNRVRAKNPAAAT